MNNLPEVAKIAAEAMKKVCEGCLEVREDSKTHQEAKTLSSLVRRDLIRPLDALQQALESLSEKRSD